MAGRHGSKATFLNFPLMFPPPVLDGYVVPGGWMPWRQLRLGCYPSDLYDKLKALPGFNARELAMDPALEAKALEGCLQEEYEDWVELHIRREQHWFEILRYLMEHDPCELTAVLFDGADKIQHLCWRFLDPASMDESPSPWEQRIRDLCLKYFRQLDSLLAEIVALSDPEARFVIASDHGFGPTHEVFHINAWLEKNGYLAWADSSPSQGQQPGELGIGKIGRDAYQLDWEKTKAYVATPSSNGVHIVRSEGQNGAGVPADEYEGFRDELAASLKSFEDPQNGGRVVSGISTREDAFPGPYQDLAPDLTLALRDGGLVSILPSDVPLKPRDEIKGSHRPEGVFMAKGPGIRQGVTLEALSIVDVTPLLLHCLDLPIPEDLDGRLPTEVFEDSMLEERTVRVGAAVEVTRPVDSEDEEEYSLSPEDEATMVERLRALGYIE